MINLIRQTDDFIKDNKFGNKNDVKSEKIKYFRWFAVSTCPPEQVLAGPDMSDFGLLVKFRTFRIQKWYFDEIYE